MAWRLVLLSLTTIRHYQEATWFGLFLNWVKNIELGARDPHAFALGASHSAGFHLVAL